MITGGFGITINLNSGTAHRWTVDANAKKQYKETTMICPECGDLLNYIDDKHIECCGCGWAGTMKQWQKLIQAT